MEIENKTAELRYSLSLIQRLLNPIGAFIYRVLSILLILIVICGLIMGGYSFLPMWIFAFVIILIDILVYGRYLLGTVLIIFERDHSRCLIVGPEYVLFGHKKPEFQISRKLLKVEKGIAGTNLIGFVVRARFAILSSMHYIMVPQSVISISELKKLIEVDEVPSQDKSEKIQ